MKSFNEMRKEEMDKGIFRQSPEEEERKLKEIGVEFKSPPEPKEVKPTNVKWMEPNEYMKQREEHLAAAPKPSAEAMSVIPHGAKTPEEEEASIAPSEKEAQGKPKLKKEPVKKGTEMKPGMSFSQMRKMDAPKPTAEAYGKAAMPKPDAASHGVQVDEKLKKPDGTKAIGKLTEKSEDVEKMAGSGHAAGGAGLVGGAAATGGGAPKNVTGGAKTGAPKAPKAPTLKSEMAPGMSFNDLKKMGPAPIQMPWGVAPMVPPTIGGAFPPLPGMGGKIAQKKSFRGNLKPKKGIQKTEEVEKTAEENDVEKGIVKARFNFKKVKKPNIAAKINRGTSLKPIGKAEAGLKEMQFDAPEKEKEDLNHAVERDQINVTRQANANEKEAAVFETYALQPGMNYKKLFQMVKSEDLKKPK